jgi:hypothetical protein
MLMAAGGAAVAALVVAAMFVRPRTPAASQTMRFALPLPEGMTLTSISAAGRAAAPVTLSPDGRRIALLLRNAAGRDQLWVRSLDALAPRPLAGTEGAAIPFWSPDSRFLGFFADGKVKKIEVSGGLPITLCALGGPGVGGTWNRDGVIVFGPGGARALQKVSASGGEPTAATTLAAGEVGHLRPTFLPDGRLSSIVPTAAASTSARSIRPSARC